MNGSARDLRSDDQADTARLVTSNTEPPLEGSPRSPREATDHHACRCKQAPVVAWQLCPEE